MPEISASSAAEFRQRLARLGVRAVVIGAVAANSYRTEPRLTTDIDFLADTLDGLADGLRRAGYEVRVVSEPDGEPYLLFIRGRGEAVDVMLAETEYQMQAMNRAVDGVITAEDVVVHKLLAWRDRDRDDIASILAAGHDLDDDYITNWARAWDVADRWDQVRPR